MLLAALPSELLPTVAGHLDAVSLLSLALVSRVCRVVAYDDALWVALLSQQLAPMVRSFFDGTLPAVPPDWTWRQYYFELRSSWKQMAQQRTGRLLVQVGEQCMSGRKANELTPIFEIIGELWRPRPKTYGIYDVTAFISVHPGADLIIRDAAAEADATATFEINGHSDEAVRRLRTLVVAGLEALPYDHALDDRRLSRHRCRWLEHQAYRCAALLSTLGVGALLWLVLSWSTAQLCYCFVLALCYCAAPACARGAALCRRARKRLKRLSVQLNCGMRRCVSPAAPRLRAR